MRSQIEWPRDPHLRFLHRRLLHRLSLAILLALICACGGCLTYSSFESARLVEPGAPRVTYSLSRNNFAELDQQKRGWTLLEIQSRYPLKASRLDAGFKLSAMRSDEGWVGFVIGGGLKGSIWKDHLAFDTPMSVFVGDLAFYTFEVHPGLIASVPLQSGRAELNVSVHTYLITVFEDAHTYSGSVGLALSKDLRRWAVRPEISWLRYSDRGVNTYPQFGIGVEVPLPKVAEPTRW